jgi:hypothetical protein
MAMRALLQGNAGSYQIRGAIWELGSFAYRACLHLVPAGPALDRSRSVVSADGMTLQEVIGAAKAQVKSTIGTPVERLEVAPLLESEPGFSGPATTTARCSTPSSSDGLRIRR